MPAAQRTADMGRTAAGAQFRAPVWGIFDSRRTQVWPARRRGLRGQKAGPTGTCGYHVSVLYVDGLEAVVAMLSKCCDDRGRQCLGVQVHVDVAVNDHVYVYVYVYVYVGWPAAAGQNARPTARRRCG
jgi:hypothetical protein